MYNCAHNRVYVCDVTLLQHASNMAAVITVHRTTTTLLRYSCATSVSCEDLTKQ